MDINWEIILKFIETLIWPLVVIVGVYLFRNEFRGLINRIQGGKLPGGIEFQSLPSQKEPDTSIPSSVEETIDAKRMELEKKYEEMSYTGETLQKQVDDLITQIAGLETALFFERTYQTIFGSQIKLLEELRLRGTIGIYYEDIAAYYEQIKKQWPSLNSYALESYINHLTNSSLIELFFEENKRKYRITAFGIDFLEYIQKLNYTKIKTL
jgi:hypothetical protein